MSEIKCRFKIPGAEHINSVVGLSELERQTIVHHFKVIEVDNIDCRLLAKNSINTILKRLYEGYDSKVMIEKVDGGFNFKLVYVPLKEAKEEFYIAAIDFKTGNLAFKEIIW